MNRWLRRLFALALLAAPLLACAATAIFYQPQLADRRVAESHWPGLFAQARARGFDTVVVQWVEYGPAFADQAGRAWLERRVREVRAAGLRVVLGLGSDPAFFERQHAPEDTLEGYLRQLADRDARLARAWTDELGEDAIAGWYLPLEIDDVRWRDAEARTLLVAHLERERRQLEAVLPRPVYVTSFFAGNMAPAPYTRLLEQIAATGVRVWVQDGAGTGRLNAGERGLYLAAAQRCGAAPVRGIVYELFRQTAHDAAFAAEPLAPAEAAPAMAQRAPCGGDSAFFELRYLPGTEALLAR
ncbi:DUF4434 domain-containing protein [Frateuria defendens]|uniref:DUF4434 domain-containing protein n=1 Tax=Frateuria defendens TaxID=2219559 RepID=UPI0007DC1900|nr:DUF4434 domain-containing protein [Frateuria defendens]